MDAGFVSWGDVLCLALSFGILLALGLPVSFAIGLATTITILLAIPFEPAMTTVAQQMAVGIDSFSLVAIPFFVLAGQIMNRGGIARRLVAFAKAVVGRLPGGLAYVNVLAAMLFGAISGSAVAAASAIGGTLAPQMEREGYDRAFGAAVNITAATTGLLIPPSNILIVYSLASGGVSISALFLAGYLPGILLGLCLMVMAGWMGWKKNYPVDERLAGGEVWRRFLGAAPSLALFLVVIGGIVLGIFTATEAAAVAVAYSLFLATVYREMKLSELPVALREAGATTAVVLLLVATSMAMSWLLSFERIPQQVSAGLLALSGDKVVLLLLINAILLVVGTLMDMTPAVLLFTPIFLPVAQHLGLDPVHFGIVLVLNLCIGLCTPPVGSVLFVGCGIAKVSIGQATRALWPFLAAMVAALLLVTFIPALSLAVPRLFGF